MKIDLAAKIAIANVLKEGLTDIFPQPCETALLKNQEFQKAIRSEVVKTISGGSLESLKMFPIEHVLLPKTAAFDFRRCALIQPLDTIKYLTLTILFAEEIEKYRPSKARKIVFSYRYSPSKGYLFDQKYTITSFTKYTLEKAKQTKTKVLVSCDIANFYDRLNLHRLESILISLALDKNQVRLLNELLLFWANRDSYGLPVGSNASRILAEASLLEVDNFLLSIGVSFCRFVDDYRIFAPDAHTAHHWLTQLIERLWLEGLTINKSKTKIEDVSDWKKEDRKSSAAAEAKTGEKSNPLEEKESEEKHPFRIIAGYGGTIPTRFRKPTAAEREKLSEIDAETLLNKIKSSKLVASEDIHTFVRAVLYGKKTKLFAVIPQVLDKFPQFTPYVIDLLIKHKDEISENIRTSIRDAFSSKLTKEKYLPEYLAIAYIRILGADGFQDGDALFDHFRALRRNAGAYIGRALLDALENVVSRGQVLEIRRYFVRADSWEKRQIVRIIDRHLHEDEKRPWLKNIKVQEASDHFLVESINSTIKHRKKKRKKSP
ncbi:RNA-directed DNA polymerase [Syntrophobacter fumaroxidans]|uniref:Reverse transcriptase domain-containing protein n=1 Tax=Syntrophobacter fumaroxidans (strain DSM 10017 / MPOB) TaxID=335543 RepID=A0LK30_SYNFM|nr:RNA-directed DNA polymerase [Syntrophobacter fumaroxidans]ABK17782.1 hypothetical protein Sfum_2099 [Syntrophobacter fumaroxidans MPOB]